MYLTISQIISTKPTGNCETVVRLPGEEGLAGFVGFDGEAGLEGAT
jgi:hypothetical protein